MIDRELEKFVGESSLTLAEAMRRIDANAGGVLFLVDGEGHVKGCLTDGDVRRFLLSGGGLDAPAMRAANPNPRIARDMEQAHALYHRKNYVAIPIVDDAGRIVDIYAGVQERPRPALNVPVVINAGGKGTRLDPFTRVLPKPLIPVGELPIIEHIMRQFQSYACEDFRIIVNYKRQLMKAYFAESENRYRISWHDEERPLGTGGGLRLLRGQLDGTFFFTNCDNLLTANYASMLEFHRAHKNAVTMICAWKNFNIPYGVVDMGVNGRIEAMREKPVMSFLTNTGIYIVEPEVIEDIGDDEAIGFPDVVAREIQKGRNVAAFPVGEREWMDMGQLTELEKMRKRLSGEE